MLSILFNVFIWIVVIWLLFGLVGALIEFLSSRKEIETIKDIFWSVLYSFIVLILGMLGFFAILKGMNFKLSTFFKKLFKPVITFLEKPRFNQKNKEKVNEEDKQ